MATKRKADMDLSTYSRTKFPKKTLAQTQIWRWGPASQIFQASLAYSSLAPILPTTETLNDNGENGVGNGDDGDDSDDGDDDIWGSESSVANSDELENSLEEDDEGGGYEGGDDKKGEEDSEGINKDKKEEEMQGSQEIKVEEEEEEEGEDKNDDREIKEEKGAEVKEHQKSEDEEEEEDDEDEEKKTKKVLAELSEDMEDSDEYSQNEESEQEVKKLKKQEKENKDNKEKERVKQKLSSQPTAKRASERLPDPREDSNSGDDHLSDVISLTDPFSDEDEKDSPSALPVLEGPKSCSGRTLLGKQCKKLASYGSQFCKIHRPSLEPDPGRLNSRKSYAAVDGLAHDLEGIDPFTDPDRCCGRTKARVQCRNRCQPGMDYCRLHKGVVVRIVVDEIDRVRFPRSEGRGEAEEAAHYQEPEMIRKLKSKKKVVAFAEEESEEESEDEEVEVTHKSKNKRKAAAISSEEDEDEEMEEETMRKWTSKIEERASKKARK